MIRRTLAFAVAAGLLSGLAAYAADAPSNDYVGVNKCKMCHMKEYKAWAETKHAHALENLKAADAATIAKMAELLKVEVKDHPETNAECVHCHVTGYKKAGGYSAAADSAKNAGVAFVACEACHGPGTKHMAVPMSDKEGRKKAILHPTAETCQGCHTAEISPKFDFAEKSKLVHPIAAAAPAK